MKKLKEILVFFLCSGAAVEGVPSSLFWTNCSTDIVAAGTVTIDMDNYFTIFNRVGQGSYYPPDAGATLGLFSWKNLNMEVGIDYFGGTDYPLFFNGKIGIEENKLFANAPAVNIGIFGVGTKSHVTDQNVCDFILGKNLKSGVRLFLGAFAGNNSLGPVRSGIMGGFDYGFSSATSCEGKEYKKWYLAADYSTGNNILGGGGVGLSHYFSPDIFIQGGPIWFNDRSLNGRWKVLLQFSANFPVFTPDAATPARNF